MANKKFKFGCQPKEFKRTITIFTVDGDPLDMEITFKYRTKKEFAELADEGIKKAKDEYKANKSVESDENIDKFSDTFWTELYDKVGKNSAEHVLKIARGWDIEDEFNESNLMRLENEFPGSLKAISAAYATAVSEERVKN